VFICGLICGCSKTRPPYHGPTEPLTTVVERINANAEKLPTLRGEGRFDARIVDRGRTQPVAGDVTLLYMRPRSMRFIGKDALAGPVFEIASNDERYWVLAGPSGNRTMYHGQYANLDRIDTSRLPVRPDLVLEVLGIQSIATNLLQPPVPVMRFHNDQDVYMLVWNAPLPDRWIAVKEIWYDRETLLPRVVLLFDEHGRIVLRAYLMDHAPVEVQGLPKDQWPMVATAYRLYFPQTGSTMNFDLKIALEINRKNVPNERSFPFPDQPDASEVIDLDAQRSE
jgi:hypothetical protein